MEPARLMGGTRREGWAAVRTLLRVVALALAVRSHGAAPGKDSDRCFPARADHFLHWLQTGENRG